MPRPGNVTTLADTDLRNRSPRALRRRKVSQPPPLMLVAVVQHVAALAERLEVARPIVAGVVVEMRGCEDDLGCSDRFAFGRRRAGRQAGERLSFAVAPDLRLLVPPAAVAEVNDDAPVRAAAPLAPALGAAESDRRPRSAASRSGTASDVADGSASVVPSAPSATSCCCAGQACRSLHDPKSHLISPAGPMRPRDA